MNKLIFSAILLLAGTSPARALSVLNSKHDLSALSATSGPKAVSGGPSVCMFCHTIHKPAVLLPLWNRPDSPLEFSFYSSNYLNNFLGMKAPTMADLNASKTKLCLSCHDGVTALGGLFSIRPEVLDMTGGLAAAAVIGADLSNDHPVLYDVKPGAGPPTQPGTDPEIQLPPPGDEVKVFGPSNRVECVSCHDPHDNQFGDFLAKSNADAALCTSCHIKTNYLSSAHATSNVTYTPPGGTQTTLREYSCRSCHKTHGASPAQAYILQGAEEGTCYACHGAPSLFGAKDIKSTFAKASAHPTETIAGIHINPELTAANLGAGKRHAECWDCHNPHQARAGTHATPGNKIGNALLGAWGVEPAYGAAGAWQAATAFTRQVFHDTANYKEYQLCFKCHSYYAFGITAPAGYTDQSIEFNPQNRSVHPVRNTNNEQTGAVNPKGLQTSQLSPPWNVGAKMSHQTMTCSDCHGSDVPSDPKGPHGSASQYMLKGPRRYWPKNASGVLWGLRDIKENNNNWQGDLFCVNCHPMTQEHDPHKEHDGNDFGPNGLVCVACHVVNPHGSRRSRLIGYESDPAPYNYNGSGTQRLLLRGFKKASTPNAYQEINCYSEAAACHKHNTNGGGYDP